MEENKELVDDANENIAEDMLEKYVELEEKTSRESSKLSKGTKALLHTLAAVIKIKLRLAIQEDEDKSEQKDKNLDRLKLNPKTENKYKELNGKITGCFADLKTTQRDFRKRAEECVKQMRSIASALDKFHKGSIIASVAGSSVGIAGGITTIVGLCLAPVTFGASLIVTLVGIGVATAGGVTGAAASIADRVNIKTKCNKVDKLIKELNDMKKTIQVVLGRIDSLMDEMTDLLGMETDIARAGGRGVYTAVEIARLAQLIRLSASAARGAQIVARGAQAAAAVSGVLAALFIVVDIGFVVKGAMELSKGAKCEEAKKIREIADELEKDYKMLKVNEKDCSEKEKNIKGVIQTMTGF